MGNIDMTPREYVEQKREYRIDLICVVIFAVVMVILVGAEIWTAQGYNAAESRHATAAGRFAAATGRLEDFSAIAAARNAAAKGLTQAADVTGSLPTSRIFHEVAQAADDDVAVVEWSLTRLDEMPQPAVAPAEDAGLKKKRKVVSSKRKPGQKPPAKPLKLSNIFRVEIQGAARDDQAIIDFEARLEVNDIFQQVDLPWALVEHGREIEDTKCVFFRMTLYVDTSKWLEQLDDGAAAEETGRSET